MKHPNHEEWIPYLFGEAESETKKRLATHLNNCPGCAEELQTWRRSLRQLDSWKLPAQKHRRLPRVNPVLNFAAAALLVLGLGFGLGRWFPSTGQWQKQLVKIQQESNIALDKLRTEMADADPVKHAEFAEQLISLIRSERTQDQQTVAAWVENLRKQHEADFVSLRKDLETVATTTDDRIRAAQIKLLELTSLDSTSNH